MSCEHILEVIKSTPGNATLKLIAVLEALGVTSTADLAEATGLTKRAIRKQKGGTTVPLEGDEQGQKRNYSSAQAELQYRGEGTTVPRGGNCSSAPSGIVVPFSRARGKKIITTTTTKVLPRGQVVGATSSPPAQKTKSEKPKKNGTRLPDDWVMPDDWVQWARINQAAWSADDVAREAAKFRNHFLSAPGARGVKLRWDLTWQNWVMTASSTRNQGKPLNYGRNASDESRMRALLAPTPRRPVVSQEELMAKYEAKLADEMRVAMEGY